ncbi:Fc.00g037490.m01.CDS01 [Cosmosporella sp. VM-42]
MTAHESQRSIFSLAGECDKLVTSYISKIESFDPIGVHDECTRPALRLMKDYQARFNAWSSYMGVFADERISLDRRLINTPDIRNSVVKLLEVLNRNLYSQIIKPGGAVKDSMATTKGQGQGTPGSVGDVRDSKGSQDRSIPETKASTLKADEFNQIIHTFEAAAGKSSGSLVSSAPAGNIRYPKPPKAKDGLQPVICQWCFEPLSDGYDYEDDYGRPTRLWRRHVDHDLKPYICLAETCIKPCLKFDRLSLWRVHMKENHSPHWAREIHQELRWCCDIDHPIPLNFPSSEVLESHVHQTHGDTFTRTQIASILRRSSGHMMRQEGVCPFRCSYDAAEDPTVNDSSTNLRELHKRSLPEKSPQSSRKRQKKENHSRSKSYRKVRFAEELSHDSGESSDSEQGDLGDTEKGTGNLQSETQRALSRHIAMHLTTLSFLTLRFKDLQEKEDAQDDDASTSWLPSDETSDDESNILNSDLDSISLTFDEDPVRLENDEVSLDLDEDSDQSQSDTTNPSTRQRGLEQRVPMWPLPEQKLSTYHPAQSLQYLQADFEADLKNVAQECDQQASGDEPVMSWRLEGSSFQEKQ